MTEKTEALEIRIEMTDGQAPALPEKVTCRCGKDMNLGSGYEVTCPNCCNAYQKEIHMEKDNDKKTLLVRLLCKGKADTAAKQETSPQKGSLKPLDAPHNKETAERVIKISENAQTFRCFCGKKTKLAESTIVTCSHCGQHYVKKLEARKNGSGSWDTDRSVKKEYCLYPMNDAPLLIVKNTVKRKPISSSSGWHS